MSDEKLTLSSSSSSISSSKNGFTSSATTAAVEIPCNLHGTFLGDPTFTESWKIIEKQEDRFGIEHNKMSLEKNSPLRSMLIKSPLSPKPSVDNSASVGGPGSGQTPTAAIVPSGDAVIFNFDTATDLDEMESGKDNYQIILDVQDFEPADISVTRDKDEPDTLIVQGKHDSKTDLIQNGVIARNFTRKYKIPADVNTTNITANMSSDAVLQILLPKTKEEEETQGRQKMPVKRTTSFLTKIKNYVIHSIPEKAKEKQPIKFGIRSDKHNFKVLVNVKDFLPEELKVRITSNFATVEAKHRSADGLIESEFRRVYDLPKCISNEEISCQLVSASVLEITAPKQITIDTEDQENKKKIEIVVTKEAEEEIEEIEDRKRLKDINKLNWTPAV